MSRPGLSAAAATVKRLQTVDITTAVRIPLVSDLHCTLLQLDWAVQG